MSASQDDSVGLEDAISQKCVSFVARAEARIRCLIFMASSTSKEGRQANFSLLIQFYIWSSDTHTQVFSTLVTKIQLKDQLQIPVRLSIKLSITIMFGWTGSWVVFAAIWGVVMRSSTGKEWKWIRKKRRLRLCCFESEWKNVLLLLAHIGSILLI